MRAKAVAFLEVLEAVGICCVPNVFTFLGKRKDLTFYDVRAPQMVWSPDKRLGNGRSGHGERNYYCIFVDSYFSSSRHMLCCESLLSLRRLSQDNKVRQQNEDVPYMMCAMASLLFCTLFQKPKNDCFQVCRRWELGQRR